VKKTKKIFAELMKEHELLKVGWTYSFDQANSRFGWCDFNKKHISISEPICLLNEGTNFPVIKDTILHEIAHALTYEQYGNTAKPHGKEWQEIAKQIGCNGERCYNSRKVIAPEPKYKYKCPKCGYTYNRYRKISKSSPVACSDCCDKYNNKKYSKKYNFVLVN